MSPQGRFKVDVFLCENNNIAFEPQKCKWKNAGKIKKDFIFGLPINQNGEILNALAFIENGELKAISTKKNLNRFDKGFSLGEGFCTIEYKKQTIAFGFLEDLDEYLKKQDKADLIICSSNILFTPETQKELLTSLQPKIRKAKTPIVLVNRCRSKLYLQWK